MSALPLSIRGRLVGPGHPVYVIAELSANHNQDLQEALKLIHLAAECGVDAVKLQTYTPDTITIDCRNEHFMVKSTIWEGKNLYDLYGEAYTPWEWHEELLAEARSLGLDCFSTPFDVSAVDFLEQFDPPAYKIASFELVDIPLIKKVAATGRPMIMSTGMATFEEISEAVEAARSAGATEIALLKCNSGYPAPPEEMNLASIPALAAEFGLPVGLSDHTLAMEVPIAAVALGACILEKHFTFSRSVKGPDSEFSLEPTEFKATVDAVRTVERALGKASFGPTEREVASKAFRRSLFVVEDVKAGDVFTSRNVRSIRPGAGLAPKHYDEILGKHATRDIERGTPVDWSMVS